MDIMGHWLAFHFCKLNLRAVGKRKKSVRAFLISRRRMGDLQRLQQRRTTDLEERAIRVTPGKPLRDAVGVCVWSSALTRKSPH